MRNGQAIFWISANCVIGALNLYWWNDPVNLVVGCACLVTAAYGSYVVART